MSKNDITTYQKSMKKRSDITVDKHWNLMPDNGASQTYDLL